METEDYIIVIAMLFCFGFGLLVGYIMFNNSHKVNDLGDAICSVNSNDTMILDKVEYENQNLNEALIVYCKSNELKQYDGIKVKV